MCDQARGSWRFSNARERFSGSSTFRKSFNQAGPPPRGPSEGQDLGRIHVAQLSDSIAQHADRSQRRRGTPLLADAELGDDSLIPFGIVLLQVVKQATPLADEHEQTPA